MKISQGGIKKLKREIERGEFGGLIVDRSKSQQEIDTQTDRLSGEFRKTESSDGIHEFGRDGNRNPEGLGEVFPEEEKLDLTIAQVSGWVGRQKKNDPKEREQKRQSP